MELNYIYEPHLSQSSVFFYQFLLPIIENVLYFLHIPPSLLGKISCVSPKKLFAGDLRISETSIHPIFAFNRWNVLTEYRERIISQ